MRSMHHHSDAPRRRAVRLGTLLLLLAGGALSTAAAQQLRGRVIANGGTSASGGGNYTLQGTIGQPVAGRASNGTLVLDGGFWQPAPVAAGASIFSNGFED